MRKFALAIGVILYVMGLAAGCTPTANPGPSAWIDQPLDNSQLPVAPVVVTAHASDQQGVASIEFFIGETSLVNVKTDGSGLASASTLWNPPAPGAYTIRVRGVNNQGNPGDFASAVLQVGSQAASGTPTPAPAYITTGTPTPAPAIITTGTPTPAPNILQISVTVTAIAQQGPVFQAGSNANCRSGPGTVYEIDDVLHKDQAINIEGRSQDGSWIWIPEPSGGSGHCWVSVVVGTINGDLSQVPVITAPLPPVITITVPPLVIITAAPLPLSPPAVTMTVSNSTLLTEGNPCTNYPKTITVQANVQAGNGVSQVTLHWNQNGSPGNSPMSFVGGQTYNATLGPFAVPGTATVWVEVIDNAGLTGTSANTSIDVSTACIQ